MAFIQDSKSKLKFRFFLLDPRTKLLLLLIVSFLSFMINKVLVNLFFLNIMLIIAILVNIDWKKFYRYIKPTLWLIPTIFLIQIIFANDTAGTSIEIFVHIGFLSDFARIGATGLATNTLTLGINSLLLATNSCLRILNLAIASCLFSLTTNSNDYLQSLTKIGIPYGLAFTTGLVIYFLPMVVSETNEARMSLETRGVSINRGSFIDRLRNFRILSSSILINFIEKSKYQAIALDSRGFNPRKKRNYYRTIKLGIFDFIIGVIAIAFTIGICYLFRFEIKNFFAGFWSST